MPNQKDSPEKAASPGSIGPIDQGWERFVDFNNWRGQDPSFLAYAKFCYYCGSMDVYNAMMNVLRLTIQKKDPKITAAVTAAFKQNLDLYFKEVTTVKPPTH